MKALETFVVLISSAFFPHGMQSFQEFAPNLVTVDLVEHTGQVSPISSKLNFFSFSGEWNFRLLWSNTNSTLVAATSTLMSKEVLVFLTSITLPLVP